MAYSTRLVVRQSTDFPRGTLPALGKAATAQHRRSLNDLKRGLPFFVKTLICKCYDRSRITKLLTE